MVQIYISTIHTSICFDGRWTFNGGATFIPRIWIDKYAKEQNVFRKLNLKGNEIEIFEESDDSYFDKYLNEVLYLFENVDLESPCLKKSTLSL